MPDEGSLRVWLKLPGWRLPFEFPVASPDEADWVLNLLADFCHYARLGTSALAQSGLRVFSSGKWLEWISADGNDIHHMDHAPPV